MLRVSLAGGRAEAHQFVGYHAALLNSTCDVQPPRRHEFGVRLSPVLFRMRLALWRAHFVQVGLVEALKEADGPPRAPNKQQSARKRVSFESAVASPRGHNVLDVRIHGHWLRRCRHRRHSRHVMVVVGHRRQSWLMRYQKRYRRDKMYVYTTKLASFRRASRAAEIAGSALTNVDRGLSVQSKRV